METNPITRMEALSLDDLRLRDVDLVIKMITVHHMQEAMLPMLIKTNPKIEQDIRTVLKREVQEEMWDVSHLGKDINQVKRGNYPVENASKIPNQIFLGV